MEIIIHEAFINAVIQAVERQRPEILAAHSDRFHKSIPFPYNQNEPTKSTKLEASKSELDFDARASKGVVRLYEGQMQAELAFESAVKRTRAKVTDDGSFQLGASVSMDFSTKPVDKLYHVQMIEFQVKNLLPVGLASLVSWLALEGLCESASKSGFPSELVLFDGKLKILLDPPEIKPQKFRLRGRIK